jgi:predicted transcriptional regulator
MMTKVWDELLRRVQSWPQDAQEELAQVALEIETALKKGAYRASPSELDGIDRGLRDAADGKFAAANDGSFRQLDQTFSPLDRSDKFAKS